MAFGFKLGGGSPAEKLLSGKLKDDEKPQLLAALAGASAPELIPLLSLDDPAIMSRAAQLFLPRADGEAVQALLEDLLERSLGAPLGLKVLLRCREEHLQAAFEGQLARVRPEQLRRLWELGLELPGALGEAVQQRAVLEAPAGPRLAALKRLLKAKGPEGLRALLLSCSASRDLAVRREALAALKTLSGDDVFAVMLDRLGGDDSRELRDLAAAYLKAFLAEATPEVRPRVLGKLLLAGDEDTRRQLVQSMFGQGTPDGLLEGVLQYCRTLTGAQHRTVMRSLGAVGAPLVPAVLVQLRGADADLRVQAVHLAEVLADGRLLGPLKELLRDPDWWVRIAVCEALGKLKVQALLPALQATFTDPDARWAAIEAVGALGGEAAASALLPLLRDPSPEVRSLALGTLQAVQDARVPAAVAEVARQDPSPEVRLKALEVQRALQGELRPGAPLLSSKELTKPLDKMLAYAREREASDLLITPGEPPVLRVHGALERVPAQKIDAQIVTRLLEEVLDPARRSLLDAHGSVDFCHAVAGVGRFRANVYAMRRGLAAAFRCVPGQPSSLADLGLPPQLAALAGFHQGIVLVSGPAASGKSTTLTAMVNLVNETRAAHVITFEEPVEFVHTSKKALINQREIGRDSLSYASAIRGALREDPDVVVVGDLRDPETVRLALLAAETGHLVIATLQTTGAVATIDKVVDAFPPDEHAQIRGALAASLKVVVSQLLVPRATGRGRVAVFEVLRSTASVRALIREGKTVQLPSAMTIARGAGMQTLEGALEERVRAGLITAATALQFAPSPEQLQKLLQGPAPTAVASAPSGLRPAVPASSASALRPAPQVGSASGLRPAPPGSSPSSLRPATPSSSASGLHVDPLGLSSPSRKGTP
jgi:twitching motility protein PilT